MGKLKAYELPFYNDLFYLAEAMQYSLSDYHKLTEKSSDYQRQNHNYWINQINQKLNKSAYNQMVAFKAEHNAELNENPLLVGLIDMYIKAFEAKDEQEYKQVYEEYQDVQRNHPVEQNLDDYIAMGCALSVGYFDDTGKLKLSYPLPLYTAYTMHGGKDDDYRGGRLFPLHELTDEQVLELHEKHPELFEGKKHLIEAYRKVVAKTTHYQSQPGEE